uniref:Uncharacterized protein n=1 Tax=Knipowitschia caucasica TaxID=637954 RepID=A0AAV2J9H7_KNICA
MAVVFLVWTYMGEDFHGVLSRALSPQTEPEAGEGLRTPPLQVSNSLSSSQTLLMENATDATELWEYYYDYVDPVTVDETKLSFNKYLMAIIFWMVLSVSEQKITWSQTHLAPDPLLQMALRADSGPWGPGGLFFPGGSQWSEPGCGSGTAQWTRPRSTAHGCLSHSFCK